jgi:hydroxyacylglutathione hydrolase
MKIETIPIGDNFSYLLIDGNQAAVVDPTAAGPIERALGGETDLKMILLTHCHHDHTAGCAALRRATGCRIVGPAGGCGLVDEPAYGGDTIALAGEKIDVLAVPGHTRDDLAYSIPGSTAVFTGDTLFACGCGRCFGCPAETMWESLCRLRALPEETRVFGGHDYLHENLEFAGHLEPANVAIKSRREVFIGRSRGTPWPVSTMGEERVTNPFLRCDVAEFRAAVGMEDATPAEVFAEIRSRKDRW